MKLLDIKNYLQLIGIPLLIVVGNFIVFNFLLPDSLTGIVTYVASAMISVTAVLYAGWLTILRYPKSRWAAAWSGVLVHFFEHVTLKGIYLLVGVLLYKNAKDSDDLQVFAGILISFVLFIPIAMLLGALGGWFARKLGRLG